MISHGYIRKSCTMRPELGFNKRNRVGSKEKIVVPFKGLFGSCTVQKTKKAQNDPKIH